MAVAHAGPVQLQQSASQIAGPQAQQQQQQPPSPTLTNPDLILPYDDYGSSVMPDSPSGSPPQLLPPFSSSRYLFSADKVPRRLHDNDDPQLATPPSTSHGDQTTPRGRATHQRYNDGSNLPLASSPTLASPTADPAEFPARNGLDNSKRLSLTESEGSVVSLGEDFVFNYKHLVLDGEDMTIPDDGSIRGDDAFEQGSTLGEHDDVLAESAALSRRAERILASAKKRLDNMEDNLTRARGSILIPISPKTRQLDSSEPEDSQSLGQASDETTLRIPIAEERSSAIDMSISTPIKTAEGLPISTLNQVGVASSPNTNTHPSGFARSSSAMGTENAAKLRKVGHRQSLNFSTPFRNSILRIGPVAGLSEIDDRVANVTRSQSVVAHPTFVSSESRHRSKSTVATYDIRDHMRDLKDRISSLQEKAKQDNLSRMSMQSVREGSIRSNKGFSYDGNNSSSSSLVLSSSKDKSLHAADAESIMTQDVDFEDAQSHIDGEDFEDSEDILDGYHDDEDEPMEDASEQAGERHEDRADAFDYDHLFLHNGVIIARKDSRASLRSEDSTSTTRGLDTDTGYIVHEVLSESPVDPHRLSIGLKPEFARLDSALSISTINTFQTATEGHGSDDEDDEVALAALNAGLGGFVPITAAAAVPLPTSEHSTPPTSDDDWLGAKTSDASSTSTVEHNNAPADAQATTSNQHQRLNSLKSVSSKQSLSPSILSDLGGTPKPPFSSKGHAAGSGASSTRSSSSASSMPQRSFPINPLKASPSPTLSNASSQPHIGNGLGPAKPISDAESRSRSASDAGPIRTKTMEAVEPIGRLSTSTATGVAPSSLLRISTSTERPISMNSENLTQHLASQDKVLVERIVDALGKICWHLEVDSAVPDNTQQAGEVGLEEYRARLERALVALEG